MIIHITPCLLGFSVATQAGSNGFKRNAGIFSASGLIKALAETEDGFTVVLH